MDAPDRISVEFNEAGFPVGTWVGGFGQDSTNYIRADLMAELVERATAALEGVTDGPWSVPGQPDKICAEGYTRNGMAKTIATVSTPAWMGDAEPWANACFIAFARQWVPEAAAHIAALTAKIEELRGVRRDDALELLAAHGQAQEAYAAQLAAEAEAAALRAKVARLEGALHNCVGMLDCLVAESGRSIGGDQEDPFRMGEWFEPDDLKQLAQARAALTDGGK